jgi:hypothetical protein
MSEFPANPEDVAAQISTAGDEWSEDHWPDKYSLTSLYYDYMVNPHGWMMANLRANEFNQAPISNMRKHLKRAGRSVTILVAQPREVKASAWHDYGDRGYYFKLHPLDEKLSGGMRVNSADQAIEFMVRAAIRQSIQMWRADS